MDDPSNTTQEAGQDAAGAGAQQQDDTVTTAADALIADIAAAMKREVDAALSNFADRLGAFEGRVEDLGKTVNELASNAQALSDRFGEIERAVADLADAGRQASLGQQPAPQSASSIVSDGLAALEARMKSLETKLRHASL